MATSFSAGGIDPYALVPVTALIRGPKRVLYEACRRGEIPHAKKLARVWYVRPADLAAWIAGDSTDTSAEADLMRAAGKPVT